MNALDRAAALHNDARPGEALPHWRQAIREDPMNPDVWYGAALGALAAREYGFAARMLESYMRLYPGSTKAAVPLAFSYVGLRQVDAAARVFASVVAQRPDDAVSWSTLGHCLYMLGRVDEGREAHARVLAIEPATAEQHYERGLLCLAHGRLAEGWREIESRWESLRFRPWPFWRGEGFEPWDGAPAPGRTLCLYNEGGFGDAMLFARFAAPARARVGRVLLAAAPPMARLVATAAGVDGLIRTPADVPPDALHASLWSLPLLLGTGDDVRPGAVPYLRAPDSGPALPPTDRLRVGLVWAGSAAASHDFDRSVGDVRALAPLIEVPGVEWISLQVGERAGECADAGFPVRPAPPLSDFADTAFVLRQLDLLISIDSAVVNLAGALGVRAWVSPPNVPELRWATPDWYPTVTQFRRRGTDDWPATAARMAVALAQLANERTTAAS